MRSAGQLTVSHKKLDDVTNKLAEMTRRYNQSELTKTNTPHETQRKVGPHQIPPTTRHHSSTCGYGLGGGLKPACLKPRLMHSVFVPPKGVGLK